MNDKEKLRESLKTVIVRTCRTLHECCLCGKNITLGQIYRDRGYGKRGHELCVFLVKEQKSVRYRYE